MHFDPKGELTCDILMPSHWHRRIISPSRLQISMHVCALLRDSQNCAKQGSESFNKSAQTLTSRSLSLRRMIFSDKPKLCTTQQLQ